jgi:hypothetical protein
LLTLLSRIDAEPMSQDRQERLTANMPRLKAEPARVFAKPIPAPPLPHPKPASLNGIVWPQRSAKSAAAP